MTYDAFGRIKTQQQTVPGGAGETLTLGYNRDGQPVSRDVRCDRGDHRHLELELRRARARDPSCRSRQRLG